MKVISFTFLFFLTLPISIELFPTFMNQPVIGWMTFAWLFGFAQIIVTWLLGWMYWKKAKRLDALLNEAVRELEAIDRKSTRLNSSHVSISYAVFCLKKKTYT